MIKSRCIEDEENKYKFVARQQDIDILSQFSSTELKIELERFIDEQKLYIAEISQLKNERNLLFEILKKNKITKTKLNKKEITNNVLFSLYPLNNQLKQTPKLSFSHFNTVSIVPEPKNNSFSISKLNCFEVNDFPAERELKNSSSQCYISENDYSDSYSQTEVKKMQNSSSQSDFNENKINCDSSSQTEVKTMRNSSSQSDFNENKINCDSSSQTETENATRKTQSFKVTSISPQKPKKYKNAKSQTSTKNNKDFCEFSKTSLVKLLNSYNNQIFVKAADIISCAKSGDAIISYFTNLCNKKISSYQKDIEFLNKELVRVNERNKMSMNMTLESLKLANEREDELRSALSASLQQFQ